MIATFDSSRFQLGSLCGEGHEYENTGQSLRYVRSPSCVTCAVEYRRRRDAEKRVIRLKGNPPPAPGNRRCCACKAEMPEAYFLRRSFRCPPCRTAYHAEYRRRRPEIMAKVRATQRARKTENWIDSLWRGSRSSSKARNLEHAITRDDLHAVWERQNGRCYWTGVEMEPTEVNRHPLKPSLDRIDPARGYTPDNIVLACLMVNLGRSNCGPDDFMAALDKIWAARASA